MFQIYLVRSHVYMTEVIPMFDLHQALIVNMLNICRAIGISQEFLNLKEIIHHQSYWYIFYV